METAKQVATPQLESRGRVQLTSGKYKACHRNWYWQGVWDLSVETWSQEAEYQTCAVIVWRKKSGLLCARKCLDNQSLGHGGGGVALVYSIS